MLNRSNCNSHAMISFRFLHCPIAIKDLNLLNQLSVKLKKCHDKLVSSQVKLFDVNEALNLININEMFYCFSVKEADF